MTRVTKGQILRSWEEGVLMFDLFSVLKKYNCLDVCVRISGSVALSVTGEYGGEYFTGSLPISEFVYIDDFPVLMDTLAEFANGNKDRMYSHFRIEHDGELHWAYLCLHKDGNAERF